MGLFSRNAEIADSMATDGELRDAVTARRKAQKDAQQRGDSTTAARMGDATDRALDHLNLRRH